MNRKLLYAVAAGMLLLPFASWADFKYVESTKFTGGAMAGLMKFAARVGGIGNGADGSTYYVKGNRMRVEDSDGEVQIIDLDARQIISIDPRKKSYAILTFAEMRAQMEQLQQLRGAKEQGNSHTESAGQPDSEHARSARAYGARNTSPSGVTSQRRQIRQRGHCHRERHVGSADRCRL